MRDQKKEESTGISPQVGEEKKAGSTELSQQELESRRTDRELTADELEDVSGGGAVCEYAQTVGTSVAAIPAKHWFNGG